VPVLVLFLCPCGQLTTKPLWSSWRVSTFT